MLYFISILLFSTIYSTGLINNAETLTGMARYAQNITTEKGNCNFENGSYRRLAAVGPKLFADSIACGLCIGASTSKGSIVAGVVDLCLGCDPYDILLDKESFLELGDLSLGAIKVNWKPQPCRAQGSLRYIFIKGSTPWWFSIGIRNSAAPVKKMELLVDGNWQQVKKEYYNYFTMSLPGPGPYTFRLTSMFDETLVEEMVPLLNGTSYKGKVQFSTRQGSQLPAGIFPKNQTDTKLDKQSDVTKGSINIEVDQSNNRDLTLSASSENSENSSELESTYDMESTENSGLSFGKAIESINDLNKKLTENEASNISEVSDTDSQETFNNQDENRSVLSAPININQESEITSEGDLKG